MNSPALKAPASQPSVAWWKVPHMWMVIGGPLLVVVASLFTAMIAIKGADPVLDKDAYERDLKAIQSLQGQERVDALVKLQPAYLARNHAAAPEVPATARR